MSILIVLKLSLFLYKLLSNKKTTRNLTGRLNKFTCVILVIKNQQTGHYIYRLNHSDLEY